jgi:hypothetical protein
MGAGPGALAPADPWGAGHRPHILRGARPGGDTSWSGNARGARRCTTQRTRATAEARATHRWAMPRSLNDTLRPAQRPRFPQPPDATPKPVPPALTRPHRFLAWVSMAAARGASGARVSNASLMRLGETKSSASLRVRLRNYSIGSDIRPGP